MESRTLTAGSVDDRKRLDIFVAAYLGPEYSRSRVARMIKAGLVTLNGAAASAASSVRAGDQVEIAFPAAVTVAQRNETAAAPEIEVIYSDPELIVVNKPPGMVVHAGPGHLGAWTLADVMLARFPELATMVEPDGVLRPGIVHRLDKDTSGVMVIARTPFARAELSRQFKERIVSKLYLAIVRGVMARDRLSVERAVGRHQTDRQRMSVRPRHGRAALTRVEVLARFAPGGSDHFGATLVKARPETGRTHQIRVHLASIGHPCLGDQLYGRDGGGDFRRQALHALALGIDHPRTRRRLEFLVPAPEDMVRFLAARGVAVERETFQQWARNDRKVS